MLKAPTSSAPMYCRWSRGGRSLLGFTHHPSWFRHRAGCRPVGRHAGRREPSPYQRLQDGYVLTVRYFAILLLSTRGLQPPKTTRPGSVSGRGSYPGALPESFTAPGSCHLKPGREATEASTNYLPHRTGEVNPVFYNNSVCGMPGWPPWGAGHYAHYKSGQLQAGLPWGKAGLVAGNRAENIPENKPANKPANKVESKSSIGGDEKLGDEVQGSVFGQLAPGGNL
jgi:hypothetical protein